MMLYHYLTKPPYTQVPAGEFVQFAWNRSGPTLPLVAQNYTPSTFNYVAYPSIYTAPTITSATQGSPSGDPSFTPFGVDTGYKSGATLRFLTTARYTSSPFEQRSWGLTHPVDSYFDSIFTDPARQGWCVEGWFRAPRGDNAFWKNTTGPLALLDISTTNGASTGQIPFTPVPAFQLRMSYAGHLYPEEAAAVPDLNSMVLRYGGKLWKPPQEVNGSNTDPMQGDFPYGIYGKGWSHFAFVENLLDNTLKYYLNGQLRANYTGVTSDNGLAPGSLIGKYVNYGIGWADLDLSNITFNKYPKYTTAFVPPNVLNYTSNTL